VTRGRWVAPSGPDAYRADHDHDWVAAIMYHLDDEEAETTAEFPDDLADIAASAPQETVGPFCVECGEEYGRGHQAGLVR
jgi:hypothetical protein